MNGIQKTVHDGLLYLADKVRSGLYGKDDGAFQGEDENNEAAQAFLNDMHDEVLDKMD